MKILYAHPSKFKPYPGNAKRHPQEQIDVLATSIANFGFDQPLVVDQKMVVIKGHGRLLAAQHLGMEEIPYIIRTTSDRDNRFLRVADNEVAKEEWDGIALQAEMRDLQAKGFDLDLTGFDLPDQENLLAELPPPPSVDTAVQLQPSTYECTACGYKW